MSLTLTREPKLARRSKLKTGDGLFFNDAQGAWEALDAIPRAEHVVKEAEEKHRKALEVRDRLKPLAEKGQMVREYQKYARAERAARTELERARELLTLAKAKEAGTS